MDTVNTEIDSSTGGVKISWSAPNANSETIDAYEILIRKDDGSTFEATSSCDGSSATVVSSRTCVVSMNTLLWSEYLLDLNDLVVVKGRAHNVIGWGSYSTENSSGPSVRTKPT